MTTQNHPIYKSRSGIQKIIFWRAFSDSILLCNGS